MSMDKKTVIRCCDLMAAVRVLCSTVCKQYYRVVFVNKKKQYYGERHLCLDNRPSDSQYIYVSLLIYFIINEILRQPLFRIYKRPRQMRLS